MMSKEKNWVLLSFIILAFLGYRNCFDIFIPGDNYSIFYLFDNEGIMGGIKNMGPYFVTLPIIFWLYYFIGIAPYGWIGISVILHILNAFLVYLFTQRIMHSLVKTKTSPLSFFAGLIFLISPYQTEAIVWTPTNMGFLIATSFSLLCLLLLLQFFESTNKFSLFASHIACLLAVYAWEISFILPGISILLYAIYSGKNKTIFSFKNFALKVLLPQIGIIVSYIVITKLIFDYWLWHSGNVEIAFSAFEVIQVMLKYFAKFFLFYRYLPHYQFDTFARIILNNYYLCVFLFFIIILSFVYFLKRLLKNNKQFGLVLFGIFLCFIISLLPVILLDSSFLIYIYPDRYGYLPSVFFYIFLVFALFYLFKKFAIPLLIIYCSLCWILLMQTTSVWSSVNKYCTQVIESYRPFLKYDKVYILNVPAYYKGAAAFRCAFAETIYMKYNKSLVDKIRVVSGCYQESEHDTLVSISKKGNTIDVYGPPKQTPYFSTDAGWAKSYKTNEYFVKYDLSGCSYALLFNQEVPKNSACIYTVNGIWKKVD